MARSRRRLVDDAGVQVSASAKRTAAARDYTLVDEVYRRFYFRPRKMIPLGAEMPARRRRYCAGA